ncbi:MAG: 2-oxoacid:ferredoxin oxidoreductase subunit beta [Anaerolineales bacterium]|nr:2-oxoacid:ferredoxin oxidoreductase subunit beta [Anaerolineales bacterium]MCX7608435.1 2-oxoacid:ferredoxin oxidoreductase subunit beta [Anaerolineales bacterium]MDW8227840.1 2-oxoacid:ferredoxin oxidoreductase subunit beta [Anaerolineales bacterium]
MGEHQHILEAANLQPHEALSPPIQSNWFDRSETLQKLRRNKKFPTIWCSGCGIGVVMGALLRAIDHLGLKNDQVALVSGIGCTSRMPVYLDYNTLHTTHGRALAFATGLKIARPAMKVIAIMGDGDALAIGGNHFIHAARRNIGITALVVNNSIYGMTGGQYSPTTPIGGKATTAPYGNIEPPFPICELAIAAGATYVARSTVYHALELDKFLTEAIAKDGFSVVEAVSYCHTTYGRLNRLGTAADMMRALKENSISKTAWDKLSEEEKAANGHKIVRGVFHNIERLEYTKAYDKLIGFVQGGVR